eukprot:GHUV01029887.1.p1 GENE.GHUV01029887.1~~GHUV01029887.1.p1  ORF type:complete len:154 (+),score=22.62 GHUV01029887.1:260-721(+)
MSPQWATHDESAQCVSAGTAQMPLLHDSRHKVQAILLLLLLLQTSHITPQQAGHVFADVSPRLAVAHHLTVNAASRGAIIDDIRSGYPKGALIINEDLNVYEITKEKIEVRRRLVPTRSWGYWHAESNWQTAMRDGDPNNEQPIPVSLSRRLV